MEPEGVSPDLITGADATHIDSVIDTVYSNRGTNPASGVLVADGYGITVAVKNGDLLIIDGYGPGKRTRTVDVHNRTVRRIIVLGSIGSITLAALQWCQDTRTLLANIDRGGRLIAVTMTDSHRDARMMRAQAMAFGTPPGTAIAKYLVMLKVEGHRSIIETYFSGTDWEIATMNRHITRLAETSDLGTIRKIESAAARFYFQRWIQYVTPRWAKADLSRIPQRWSSALVRASPRSNYKTPRGAVNPVNAALNYAYTLGELECLHACHRLGLEPGFGVLHTDVMQRDSMALDLLEPLRPIIETTVIGMFASTVFRKVDFTTTRAGACRLTETVTHLLTEHMPAWEMALAPVAEYVAQRIIADIAPGKVKVRTPMSRAAQREGVRDSLKRDPLQPIQRDIPY